MFETTFFLHCATEKKTLRTNKNHIWIKLLELSWVQGNEEPL